LVINVNREVWVKGPWDLSKCIKKAFVIPHFIIPYVASVGLVSLVMDF
jgi:hypothetical protein